MSSSSPSQHGDFDAWLVDLDGTLYRPLPVKIAMAAELAFAGPHATTLIRHFRRQHEPARQQNAAPGSSPFDVQVQLAADTAGTSPEDLRRTVLHWMFERPGRYLRWFQRTALVNEIRAFRESGGKTALVSDYPAEAKIQAMGLRPLFDVVVANGDAESPSRMKPDPAGMLRAAELLGVSEERCLVIGDRADADGGAAKAAGMAFRKV